MSVLEARKFRYLVIDVFTRTPFEGNPLAVFPDAEGLSTNEMQKIANEFNLSETVFIFPPEKNEVKGCYFPWNFVL